MTIKNGVCDWAKQRPLGPQTEPPIDPEVLIFHVIVGSADAGYNVFKAQGYTGDESTFIVCGPRDVAAGHKDGELWQLQNCNRQADAQFAGNAYADSVETSGMPNDPWSTAMLETNIKLSVDWFRAHPSRKPHLVNSTGPIGDGGFGYHELRHDWNLDGHVCPGAVREGQLRTIVIPKVRAILAGAPAPVTPKPKPQPAHHPSGDGKIAVDGILAQETIGAIQHILLYHGFGCGCPGHPERPDGVWGPTTRRSLQAYLHHLGLYHGIIDGDIGPATTRALQEHVGADVDGILGRGTIRHIQEALNAGRF